MSRGPARIRQADVARAIRAARQTGAGEVQIRPDGTIVVSLSPAAAATAPKPELEPAADFVL